jgi:high potential iron-sulfur protein
MEASMTRNATPMKRRDFLKLGSLAVASAAVAGHAASSWAQGQPHLDPKDAQAQALGYTHDATKADRKKFPKYQAGQACANCQLYQGKPKDAWGPCQIFAGKQVNPKGWCSAYVKKA